MTDRIRVRRSHFRRAAQYCIAGSAVLLLGAAPTATISNVSTCTCNNGNNYAGTSASPVPIFTGSNLLRIRGGNVLMATSVLIDGLGPATIVDRRVGELDVKVTVVPGAAQTIRVVRVKYPIGEDVFRARVIPRGTVTKIEELPAQVQVNQTVWVKFSGAEIHDAVIDGSFFRAATSGMTSSATSFRTQITFTRCGSFAIVPQMLHHSTAPAAEVSSGFAQYSGSGRAVVTVSGCGSPTPVCVTNTSISAPVFSRPSNGQTFFFSQGTQSGNVAISWSLNHNQTDPTNEFIVTRRTGTGTAVTQTVGSTSVTYSFPVPGDHSVKVRAKNCGQTAPETEVRFSTRIQ